MHRKLINLRAAMTVVVLCCGLLAAGKAQQSAPLLGGSPAMNYSRELLKRKDVQNELGLDANQKDALAKVFSQSHPQMSFVQSLNTGTFQNSQTKKEDNGNRRSVVEPPNTPSIF